MRSTIKLVPIALLLALVLLHLYSCEESVKKKVLVRKPIDTIGFASYTWQMDSLIQRIERKRSFDTSFLADSSSSALRLAISPHDDYAYVGHLYPGLLKKIDANTVILFGVAHSARDFGLEDRLIFEDFDYWQRPQGNVKVSEIRKDLMEVLDTGIYKVHRPMHEKEHSLEALIPFLQRFNPDIQIVPVLVPSMSYNRMLEVSEKMAASLALIAKEKGWAWGDDFSILISNDAVHYGDQDWGGKSYARYGADTAGYEMALEHEQEIITTCLESELIPEKIKAFTAYTLSDEDYKTYKWTWCGRYAVPVGLLTAFYLQENLKEKELNGKLLEYSTSIKYTPIPVEDLNMGTTAPAHIHHWVGYAAVAYE